MEIARCNEVAVVVLDLSIPGSRRFLEAREASVTLFKVPVVALSEAPELFSTIFTTRFCISALLQAPASAAALMGAISKHLVGAGPDPQRMPRALIVDDDRQILQGLSIRLRAKGFQVETACDGPAAIAMAVATQPEIVLLDLGLPFVDGFTVLDHIRTRCPATMVIVVTGRPASAVKERVLKAGAFRFFQKPAINEELLSAIDQALAYRRKWAA